MFYSTENDHNLRELTIVNVALLVGKAPTKEKRIRIKVRMILSGQAVTGAPDWISAAHAYVAQWHDPISPNVDFKGYDLHFSAQNLFDAEGVKSPRCQMRSFEIHECGDSEAPDVAATFTLYAPFSGALWQWLGQFGGESCWCSFTPGVADLGPAPSGTDEKGDEPTTEDEEDKEAEEIDAEDEEDSERELDPDNETEPVGQVDTMLADALHVFEEHGKVSAVELQRVLSISYVKASHIIEKMEVEGLVTRPDKNHVRTLTGKTVAVKSGPGDLAAYHEQVLDAVAPKRGRGRPKKNPVDPLTVNRVSTVF